MGFLDKLFGGKSKQKEQFSELMTGQLIALFKQTKNQAYQEEYLRRLQHIGFSKEEAMNMFLYESMTMKQQSLQLLARPDYLTAHYFGLKEVFLKEPKEYYISHQMFTCSEITKLWDEAEYHYRRSGGRGMPEAVAAEIFKLTRYGGGELFVEYLMSMAEHTKTDISKLQQYAFAEQGLLFKYKWNPKGNEKHPYGCS